MYKDRTFPESRQLFQQIVDPKLEIVKGFRSAARQSMDKEKLDGAPKEWFSASTAYIDAMYTVEEGIGTMLQKEAAHVSSAAKKNLYNTIGITVLAFAITFFLTIKVISQ